MKLHKLTRGSLFLALGIILPQIFHLFGGTGPVFLPMHIPVLLAGLLVCPWAGLYVGILSPLFSHFLTGMPPMAPVPTLIFMMVELPVMGVMAALLYRKLKCHILVSLLGAMIVGRVAMGLVIPLLPLVLGLDLPFTAWAYVGGAVVTGLPGIAIQLILIPALVAGVERGMVPWVTSK